MLSVLFSELTTAVAGADIKEMKDKDFVGVYYVWRIKSTQLLMPQQNDFLGHWTRVAETRKPVLAAVNGYAVLILVCVPSSDGALGSLAVAVSWP